MNELQKVNGKLTPIEVVLQIDEEGRTTAKKII